MSEKRASKESWPTVLSPTALFTPRALHARVQQTRGTRHGRGGVYPGWGSGGWLGGTREGLYRYPVPYPSQDPYLTLFPGWALPTAK